MPTESSPGAMKPQRERMCLYVDGFNLYHGLHDLARREYLWLDLVRLAESLRPRNEIAMVKYFTARVINEPDAESRQERYINALQAVHGDRFQVVLGHYKSKLQTCRHCHIQWQRNEEKETDVNIALHLLKDAMDGTYDSALLVSADSDLVPAVKMVMEARPDYFVTAAFPPKRYSADLKSLMPGAFQINKNKIRQAQLPDVVCVGASGKRYHRPDKWG